MTDDKPWNRDHTITVSVDRDEAVACVAGGDFDHSDVQLVLSNMQQMAAQDDAPETIRAAYYLLNKAMEAAKDGRIEDVGRELHLGRAQQDNSTRDVMIQLAFTAMVEAGWPRKSALIEVASAAAKSAKTIDNIVARDGNLHFGKGKKPDINNLLSAVKKHR